MFSGLDPQRILLMIPMVLWALTVHEYMHGYVAKRLGDPTADMQGRLTLNPIKHLDVIGTMMMFIFYFGWAKPVPVDPRYFKNPVRDMGIVAAAGPVINLVNAVIFSLLLRLLALSGLSASIAEPIMMMFFYGVILNIVLAVFNILPVPPLDGSRVLAAILPREQAMFIYKLEPYGMLILVLLMLSGILYGIIRPIIGFISSLLLNFPLA